MRALSELLNTQRVFFEKDNSAFVVIKIAVVWG
jgi:hypothetical protein